MTWRTVNSSVVGTSHIANGTLCQDASLVASVVTAGGETVLIMAASDGAGSAQLSHLGAASACATAHRVVADFAVAHEAQVLSFRDFSPQEMLIAVREGIAEVAFYSESSIRDLACTLLVVAVASSSCVLMQIGDGGIVYSESDALSVAFWPDSGQYANMTYFVTDDDASEHLHTVVKDSLPDAVAVFTDGLQRLALRYDDKVPHPPFFLDLFQSVRDWHGSNDELQSALANWLDSSLVNERTDDDKSIVLAVQSISQ